MKTRCLALLVVLGLVCLLPAAVYAGKKGSAIPLTATFSDYTIGVGVYSDGLGTYSNMVDGVTCNLLVSNTHAVLFTYNTPRRMQFKFDPNWATYQAALASKDSTLDPDGDFLANVDFDSINYYGQFLGDSLKAMQPGTTATGRLYLQFYAGNVTYELDYQNIAIIRGPYSGPTENENLADSNSWLITTNPGIWGSYDPNDQASLSEIRRRSVTTFGTVSMPFQIRFTLK